MNVIYYCYGGAHSSVVAAALHVGLLDGGRTPPKKDLVSVNLFDTTERREHGSLHYLGRAASGHDIYSVGFRGQATVVIRFLYSFCCLLQLPASDFVFVDTLDCVNSLMRVGGLLSRYFSIVGMGRQVVVWGTRKAFRALAARVERVKRSLDTVKDSEATAPGETKLVTARDVEPGAELPCAAGSDRRRVVYIGGSEGFAPVLCGAYHLGWLQARPGTAPEPSVVDNLLRYAVEVVQLPGRPVYLDEDNSGAQVFAVQLTGSPGVALRALESLLSITGSTEFRDDLVFRDCRGLLGPWFRLGDWLERKLGWSRLGAAVKAAALQRRAEFVADFVEETKRLSGQAETGQGDL